MYSNTTDGSTDNEAVKIANAFKPFWKKWMKEWGRNCVRSKKMTVTTAPSMSTGLIGVTDAFSDTECMIPFQNNVANANVGDTVWVKWMYDNQQTMYAENMGDIRSEKVILSGVKNAEPVPSGGSVSYSISFEKPFKETPVVVASMISPHSVETGLCSVRIWDISPFAFTVGYQNGSQYSRNIGASWIATGELLNNPIQYITDTTPYLNRAIPYSSNYLNLNKVVGGTVSWNQLVDKTNFQANGYQLRGLTVSNDGSGIVTVSGTYDATGYIDIYTQTYFNTVSGHKYLVSTPSLPSGVSGYNTIVGGGGLAYKSSNGAFIVSGAQTGSAYIVFRIPTSVPANTVFTNYKVYVNLFDLTLLFGSTIADYIYSLEQSNAGSGVAYFRKLFPNTYYVYNAGELLSVKASAHVMRDDSDAVIATYPLDSTVVLHGIPKLDADNKLYYDGDTYESDGTVTRKYGVRAYQSGDVTDGSTMVTDGTTTVYALTTPTTESADEYARLQKCDPNGTEQFIDERTVPIPIGHETEYIIL